MLRALLFVGSLLGVVGLVFPLCLLPRQLRYRACSRLLQLWARLALKIFRVRVSERPFEPPPPSQGHVIAANHVSYLDIPILLARAPCIFLAKKEVADWPLIGWVGRRSGMVFVDRGDLWSRARSLLELQTRLQQGFTVVLFPEGSTSRDGPRRGLTQFHAGAFRLSRMEEAPLELMYIDYEDLDHCAWLGDDAFVPHLFGIYSPRGLRVSLRSHWIPCVKGRTEQRDWQLYSRGWMLEGGRSL